METTLLDYLWIVMASGLVFLMQAGFAMVESGMTRGKNSINVSIKNLTDLGVSVFCFWLFGFALMFGESWFGISGFSHFFVPITVGAAGAWTAVFFLFQSMFCSTAATIVSGAVAERMKYSSYIVSTILLSSIIYPVFGHWAWGSFFLQSPDHMGWLEALGFIDFAGSTVVHSVGGWISLAALLIIGPRTGRFTKEGSRKIPGSNIPMVVLGVLLLWFGWFGFNGGSTLAFTPEVAPIIVNTTLAAVGGMLASLGIGWIVLKIPEIGLVLNGSLAGLVAITANAHVVTGGQALLIGAIGGIIMLLSTLCLEVLKIDDAVGAIPVHLAAGIWGTLAVALFGNPELIGTGLTRAEQLGVQALGVVAAGAWSFGISFVVLLIINSFNRLRVSAEHEYTGLNYTEHGASTELYDFFHVLETQARTGDLALRAPEEPFTEVGQIARRYNKVLENLEESTFAKAEFLGIMESLEEGLVIITPEGFISPFYSIVAENLLGSKDLAGKNFYSLLEGLAGPVKSQLTMGYLAELLLNSPNLANPVQTISVGSQVRNNLRYLAIDFYPMKGSGGLNNRILVIIRDITSVYVLEKRLSDSREEHETELAMVHKLLHMDQFELRAFIDQSGLLLDKILQVIQGSASIGEKSEDLTKLISTFHNSVQRIGMPRFLKDIQQFRMGLKEIKNTEAGSRGIVSLTVPYSKMRKTIEKIKVLMDKLVNLQETQRV